MTVADALVAGRSGAADGSWRATVVIPCYNEGARLPVEALRRFALQHPHIAFILVNDGSTDDTAAVIRGCADGIPSIRGLDLDTNVGKGEAVRRGLLAAITTQPDAVGYWDADLATPLEDIEAFGAMLAAQPALQMVFGARVQLMGRQIDRNHVRHYMSRVFATLAAVLLRLTIYDTQCGAKLLRNGPWLGEVLRTPFQTRWLFDVELLARYRIGEREHGWSRLEGAIAEHPLQSWRDVAGSKVRAIDLLLAAWDFSRLWARYARPVRRSRAAQRSE